MGQDRFSIFLSFIVCLTPSFLPAHGCNEPGEVKPNRDTIDQLRFQTLQPDNTAFISGRCQYELYPIGDHATIRGTFEFEKGEFTIKPPKDIDEGRVRIWVDGYQNDRLLKKYSTFSFKLADKPLGSPIRLKTKSIPTIRGKVLSTKGRRPIENAEVAVGGYFHHGINYEWENSVRTDSEGKFRIGGAFVDGIAVRHSEFGEIEKKIGSIARIENGEYLIQLPTPRELRFRFVDQDHHPIPGVSVLRQFSGDDGRLTIRVPMDLRRERERTISIFANGFDYESLALKSLSASKENVITLNPERKISLQVAGKNGKPLEGIEVKVREYFFENIEDVYASTQKVDVKNWTTTISEFTEKFVVEVLQNGDTVYLKVHSSDESVIKLQLPRGHRVSGTVHLPDLVKRIDCPWIILSKPNGDLQWVTRPDDSGKYSFSGVESGDYQISLFPAHASTQSSLTANAELPFRFGVDGAPFQASVSVEDSDIEVPRINLAAENLLPGKVSGVAYDHRTLEAAAHKWVYLTNSPDAMDSVGGTYWQKRVLTDHLGRFEFETCPPGDFTIVLSEMSNGFTFPGTHTKIKISFGETTECELIETNP